MTISCFSAPRRAHLLVMAKAPVAGRVKTRMCPPLSFAQAATIAEAALADTLDAVARCGADRRVLALDGEPGPWLPPGFEVIPQRSGGLARRLAGAWADTAGPGLQIGMDTPQVTPDLLDACLARTFGPPATASLGLATDGGWWAIGLSRRWDLDVFTGVPMSTPDTGRAQLERLGRAGHEVVALPPLDDVDHFEDARRVAALTPVGGFAQAVQEALAC
ncbi:MAG: DUF2064 domain-containing protein [Acidobacteriota bacterium]|nr:DUF2064 domain-containing protein [Acidobacteriota bacterium]